MDKKLFQAHEELEDTHWWFVGRRQILGSIIKCLNIFSDECQVLDVGCGTGGTMRWLRGKRINCCGFDENRWITNKNNQAGLTTFCGQLPNKVPFPDETFDVVLSLDVLEHIEDDESSLDAMYRLLRPGGYIIVTVPAYQFLWSAHDILNNHYRRYRLTELLKMLKKHGFSINYYSYFNTILFPLIALIRKVRSNNTDNLHATPSWLNRLLIGVFSLEAKFMEAGKKFPFGVSITIIGRKEAVSEDASLYRHASS